MRNNKEELNGLRTWIEIDKATVAANFKVFRSLVGSATKIMAVVKSNAYGHCLADFAREMENLKADFLGVDSIVEASALRKDGIKSPILVLGYTLPEKFSEAKNLSVSVTVSSMPHLKHLAGASRIPKFHIKVDTGMHRQGFQIGELPNVLAFLKDNGQKLAANAEGIYTHFAAAKNPAFPDDTRDQISQFKKWIEVFRAERFKPIAHAAATGSTILFPESHFDMVRIGIGFYGLWPAKAVEEYAKDRIKLSPILSWKTLLSEVKEVSAGERIGYDFTERLFRDTRVAVCPVGYWHGFDRKLSSVGRVLVCGKIAKILGRVSMDMITIDVTDIPTAREGSEAVLIGKQGKLEIKAEDMATLSETSQYETVTRLNPLIKRIFF